MKTLLYLSRVPTDYLTTFDGEYIGVLHKYHFWIPEDRAQKLLEVYNYEWN